MTGHFTLFLPGLLGPLPEEALPARELPRAEALAGLLNAAARRAVRQPQAAGRLAAQFGVATEPPAAAGPPIAALSHLADFGALPERSCFRCDPVHLRADIAQALLYDSRSFGISAQEAEQLTGAFNRHFADDNLQLVFRDPRRWFLLADAPPPLHATPLDEVAGRNAGAFLPEDLGARYWNRMLNETQMLFFGQAVNLEREARGEPAVNGVWIYGDGPVADAGNPPDFDEVYTDDAFCKGLAMHTGVTVRRWADMFATNVRQHRPRVLLFSNALRDALQTGDIGHWSSLLAEWETRLFAPLHQQWRAGNLARVTIDPDDGYEYCVAGGAGLRGLFRGLLGKRNGLADYLHKNPPVKHNARP